MTNKDKLIYQLGLDDKLFFIKNILGYDKMLDDFHGKLIKFGYMHWHKECSFLLPRKFFKTTLLTVACSIYDIVRNPDIKIQINNKLLDKAALFLSEIKDQFERNTKLQFYYGDFVGKKWREDMILVKGRKIFSKDPTIQIGAPGHEATSIHVDKQLNDDLAGLKDMLSEAERKHTLAYYKASQYLGETETTIWNMATRWHLDDVHGYISEQLPEESIITMSATKKDKKTGKQVSIAPSIISTKKLNSLRRKDPILYSAQMDNNPLPAGGKVYDADDFDKFNMEIIKRNKDNMKIYGWADLAFGKSNKDCESSITIVAKIDEHAYILENTGERIRSNVLLQRIIDFMLLYKDNFVEFGGEKNTGQIVFFNDLEDLIEAKYPQLQHILIKPKQETQDKELKIQLARGKLIHRTHIRSDYITHYPELITQFVNFPNMNLKDRADSCVGAVNIALPYDMNILEQLEHTEAPPAKQYRNTKSGKRIISSKRKSKAYAR